MTNNSPYWGKIQDDYAEHIRTSLKQSQVTFVTFRWMASTENAVAKEAFLFGVEGLRLVLPYASSSLGLLVVHRYDRNTGIPPAASSTANCRIAIRDNGIMFVAGASTGGGALTAGPGNNGTVICTVSGQNPPHHWVITWHMNCAVFKPFPNPPFDSPFQNSKNGLQSFTE
jgi:hypothetical protein